jgi:hypothetical protein
MSGNRISKFFEEVPTYIEPHRYNIQLCFKDGRKPIISTIDKKLFDFIIGELEKVNWRITLTISDKIFDFSTLDLNQFLTWEVINWKENNL